MNDKIKSLVINIEKVILGKRDVILRIIAAMLANGHVLIEDVPGVGKTQLVASLAKSVNGKFSRIQLTPDIMPSDIVGFTMIDPNTNKFIYRKGAAVCNFLLADEINRTSPKVQSSLLEVMEEYQISIDGTTIPIKLPFMVLATQNSIESFGTYHLPEAQMDRFIAKISVGYPAPNEEIKLLDYSKNNISNKNLEPVLTTDDVIELQNIVKLVNVHNSVKEYVIRITNATRNNDDFKLGISPRGSMGLIDMGKSTAFIKGRNYVTPDDIISVAPMVLAHRFILSSKGKSIYSTNNIALEKIISSVPVPEASDFS